VSSAATARADGLVGAQRPRIRLVPPAASSASAREAIDLAASVEIDLDPWQCYALEDALGERPDGQWAAFEVGVVVGRQNGKGKIIEARELAGLLLFGERLILHSAHEVKTATEAFIRIKDLFTNYDELRREVRRINNTHGEEGIELKTGARLRFLARSRVAGRGFSGDCVFLDEAFHLADSSMAALFPTLAARPNPQIWYLSSAVNQQHHNYGHVLARLRRRGMSDASRRLTYLDWSYDLEREDWEQLRPRERAAVRRDPAVWAATNPGYGYRITGEYIESELGALSDEDFDVERLGIGDWPTDETESWSVIPEAAWTRIVDPRSAALDPVAMSLDTTPDRSWTSIAVAGRRPDGLVHLEVIEHRTGTDWAAGRASELAEKHRPCAFVVDEGGPAASLIPAMERMRVEVTRVSGREVAAGCDHLYDLVTQGRARHRDQPELLAALAGARKRVIGDDKQWAWARRGIQVVISPVVAVTQAAYGFEMYGDKAQPFFMSRR
jgi:hypothetical protein